MECCHYYTVFCLKFKMRIKICSCKKGSWERKSKKRELVMWGEEYCGKQSSLSIKWVIGSWEELLGPIKCSPSFYTFQQDNKILQKERKNFWKEMPCKCTVGGAPWSFMSELWAAQWALQCLFQIVLQCSHRKLGIENKSIGLISLWCNDILILVFIWT